jgi:hypothetical protein
MAGVVLRVMPKRTLDFTNVSSGTGQAEEIIIAQGIDISSWREASLMVRTHANNISGAIGEIDIYAYVEGRTAEDPGILFAQTTTQLGLVPITSATGAPAYVVAPLPSNLGGMLKIAAKGTRTSSLAGNTIKCDISIDLSLKSA